MQSCYAVHCRTVSELHFFVEAREAEQDESVKAVEGTFKGSFGSDGTT